MTRLVTCYVWLLCSVQLVTLAVFLVAMVLEGPALVRCLTAFVGE